MDPHSSTRRSLLLAGGSLLSAGLAGCVGRTDRIARSGASASSAAASASVDAVDYHAVDLVCYNADDRTRTLRVTVTPAGEDATVDRSLDLDPGESARIPRVLDEPAPGRIPHEVAVATDDGTGDRETVAANAVHDLHEVHAVVEADRVDVSGVHH